MKIDSLTNCIYSYYLLTKDYLLIEDGFNLKQNKYDILSNIYFINYVEKYATKAVIEKLNLILLLD